MQTPKETTVTRKVILVPTEELKTWTEYFKLFGTKTDLKNKTHVSRSTINGILKEGKGEERVIELVRNYLLLQTKAA